MNIQPSTVLFLELDPPYQYIAPPFNSTRLFVKLELYTREFEPVEYIAPPQFAVEYSNSEVKILALSPSMKIAPPSPTVFETEE